MPRFPAAARSLTILALLAVAGSASGQSSSILVDCSGSSIPSSGSAPDIVVTSPPSVTILPAAGYTFEFAPLVYGTGFLGGLAIGGSASNPRNLKDVLNGFFVGGQRVLYGAMRNPSGAHPTLLDTETVAGTFSGLNLSLTFKQEILADGRGRASVLNIVRPTSVGLNIVSGGAVFQTFTPPAPITSEWHFEGNLQSVRDSGLVPASGLGKIRYLDDPAFGPLLGGVGNENNYPGTPTPTGVTQTQSSFGTTTSFGLPPIGSPGEEDIVYKTSPPRNAGAPADTARSRGLGLSLWPNTRDTWPDGRIGQWTLVADILIPTASWNAANAAAGNKQVVPLVEDSQHNNSAADVGIRVTGAAGVGGATAGYLPSGVAGGTPLAVPAIQPDQWFRVAISVDHYGKAQSRLHVNGSLVGVTGSGWLYNHVKSTDPRWGDLTSSNHDGSVIAPATWSGWGSFPSPWARQQVSPNAPAPATFSLFADITGRGESVYVANLMFSDEAMSDTQIAALGGPKARGIVHLRPAPCAADFNGSGSVTVQDIFDFLAAYFASAPAADFNGSGSVTVQDIFDFLSAYFTGC